MSSSVPTPRPTSQLPIRTAAPESSTAAMRSPHLATPMTSGDRHSPDMPQARSSTESARAERRQISHDIKHELATIMVLASLLATAPDVGEESRRRARLILGETRWLDQLHIAYEETVDRHRQWSEPPAPIRLDLLAEEVVAAMRSSTLTTIRLSVTNIYAHANRLTFWRSLRNVIDNAVRAAGPQGHVDVMISAEDGWAIAQVDDDGPGFDAAAVGKTSGRSARPPLGLAIVQEMVAASGGVLEISTGHLGGSCVRMQVPAASP